MASSTDGARQQRTVLVTGGNSGIGLECVRALAKAGRRVLIASRDRKASAAAITRIRNEQAGADVREMGLDLGSFRSVHDFAGAIEAEGIAIDALVCNAGLQRMGSLLLSPDGFELTFAVNHLGHFLLTNLLLDRLRANAPARIVVVSSGVHDPERHTGMPKPDVTDFETLAATGGPTRNGFNGPLAYANSKLCNMWFTYELARRLEEQTSASGAAGITVNAYDPGVVPGSAIARDYPAAARWVWDRLLPPLAGALTAWLPWISTAPKSGQALARLVLDPSLAKVSGKYFPSHTRWNQAPSSKDSCDAARARELWEHSVRMCGLSG